MKDTIIYWLIRLLICFLGIFPKPVFTFFSNIIGGLWYRLDKRHRDVVSHNIQHAYPGKYSDKEALLFAKQNFKHTASILFEVIWSYTKSREKLVSLFVVKGKENLKAAMAKKEGLILLNCHMSNFEFLPVSAAAAGIDVYALYRKLDFAPLERLVLEKRERFGTIMIPLRKASKKVEKILNEGGMVGTLFDQNVDWYKGVFVDFFNRPACSNNGLAKIVLRTNANVLPMFIMKEKEKYVVSFLPVLDLKVTNDPIKDIENHTQAFVSAIESMVRQCPEQYFWVHNRWKTKNYCPLNLSDKRLEK